MLVFKTTSCILEQSNEQLHSAEGLQLKIAMIWSENTLAKIEKTIPRQMNVFGA